jgi:hypothetical protein
MKFTGRKTEVLGEKPVPVPLRPPQIPHGPTRDRTRASAVRFCDLLGARSAMNPPPPHTHTHKFRDRDMSRCCLFRAIV